MSEVPFFTAQHAFLWAIAVHEFRTTGVTMTKHHAKYQRPCEFGDVLREASRLRLTAMEMKTIVAYARRGTPPGRKDPEGDGRVWAKAMDLLHTRLTAKGIVVPATEYMED